MSEVNQNQDQNNDLKQQALKEFELKDVKELLEKSKSSAFKIDENSFKNLDKNDIELSETEQKLYKQSKESLNIINFLESLVLELEKKENNTNTFWSYNKENRWDNINSKKDITIEKNEEITEINNILEGCNSIDDLIKDNSTEWREKRYKLLQIESIVQSNCTAINLPLTEDKNWKENYSNIYTKLLEKTKYDLIFLENYTLNWKKIEINNFISNPECKPMNLIKKLDWLVWLDWEKLNSEKIKEIIFNIATIKKDNSQNKLKEILPWKNLTLKDFEWKRTKEIQELFKEKWINENEWKIILENIKNIEKTKETQNIELEKIGEIMKNSVLIYNKLDNKEYLNNTNLVIKITDKSKFIEVLKYLKKQKPNDFLIHYDLVNYSLKSDFNLLKEFNKINWEKFYIFDSIKDINLKELNNNEKIEFLGLIEDNLLENIIFLNLEVIKNLKINNLNLKKKINTIINFNEKINLYENNEYIFIDLEDKEELKKIDNTIFDIISKEPSKLVNLMNTLKINPIDLNQFPKIFSTILNNNTLINKLIKLDYKFYQKLPINQQASQKHNLLYIEQVIKNSSDIYKDLARLQFENVKNLYTIYNKIKGNNIVKFNELFNKPLLRLTFYNFSQKYREKIINHKDKEFSKAIFKTAKKYSEYSWIYKIQVKKRKSSLEDKWIFDKLWTDPKKEGEYIARSATKIEEDFKKSKIYERLTEEQQINAQWLLVMSSYESITWKNDGNLSYFISELARTGIWKKDFKNIMEIESNIINIENKKQWEILSKMKPKSDNDKSILKDELKEDGSIDESKIKDNFNKFLSQKKDIEIQWVTLQYWTPEWEEEVLKQYWEKYSKLESIEIKNQIDIVLNWILKEYKAEQQFRNSDALLDAIKTWDFTKYNKLSKKWFYDGVEEEIIEYEKQQLSETSVEKKEQYSRLKDTEYPLDEDSWAIMLSENWLTTKITLTSTERMLVQKHPHIKENIVDFYKTLDKIWLSKLWTIKESLFGPIQNTKWIWFNIDENYLNENEIKIFLNSILKSVWEEEISPVFTLNNFISVIEQKNKTQIGWGEAIVNTYYWETYLENKLFSQFVPREWTVIWFNRSKFIKALLNSNDESNEKSTSK